MASSLYLCSVSSVYVNCIWMHFEYVLYSISSVLSFFYCNFVLIYTIVDVKYFAACVQEGAVFTYWETQWHASTVQQEVVINTDNSAEH